MIDIEFYLTSAVDGLKSCFGERLLYVGLQGSYLRGEATEESDIDLMVVIDRLSAVAQKLEKLLAEKVDINRYYLEEMDRLIKAGRKG